MTKKKNMLVVVDAENISARKASRIYEKVNKCGTLDCARVYRRKNDRRTERWSEKIEMFPGYEDVRISGGPEKNKVDNRIKKDVGEYVKKHKNIDIIVIVSADHGYSECIRLLRNQGKKVIVIAGEQASKKLVESSSMYLAI